MGRVRVSVKAIITERRRLLVLRNRVEQEHWFTLPGGGQEHGETLSAALRRECQEEIGSDVLVGPLRFVRDYIGKHHEFAAVEDDVHQLELMFECRLVSTPGMGSSPDPMQTGVEWLDVEGLADCELYPKVLRGLLASGGQVGEPRYLGDVN